MSSVSIHRVAAALVLVLSALCLPVTTFAAPNESTQVTPPSTTEVPMESGIVFDTPDDCFYINPVDQSQTPTLPDLPTSFRGIWFDADTVHSDWQGWLGYLATCPAPYMVTSVQTNLIYGTRHEITAGRYGLTSLGISLIVQCCRPKAHLVWQPPTTP